MKFLEQTQVDQGVVETVVIDVDLGPARPDLVALHAGTDSADLVEVDLTVEQMPETRLDLVTVNTETPPQTMSQQPVTRQGTQDEDNVFIDVSSAVDGIIDEQRRE